MLSCSGSTLDTGPGAGGNRIAVSPLVRQPGNHQAPGTGLRSYRVLGSGAAHQSLVLTFLTVSQAPPKGKTWAGTPRGLWCESKPRQPTRALPVYRSYSNLLECSSLVRVLESFPLAGILGTSPDCSIPLAVSRRLLLTLSLVVCNTHGSQFMELILPEPK